MKSSIFWIIPQEETKYKNIFQSGKTWHNNLWQGAKKFSEILLHYKDIVKKQKEWVETYKNRGKIEGEIVAALQKWFREEYNLLKKAGRKESLEWEIRRRLGEKLKEIKRLKEKLKKRPIEKKEAEKKKKPKEEITNEETKQKLARLKEIKKIIKEKLGEFVEKSDLEEEKRRLEEELRQKLEELRSLKEIEELEQEIREIKEEEGLERVYTTIDLWPYLNESKVEKFQEWENNFGEIEEVEIEDGDTMSNPVQILAEIKKQKDEEELKGENPYEIFIVKQTKDELIFNWSPYQKTWDNEKKTYEWARLENGKLAPVFANFEKFLFYFQGFWYEFVDFERKGWNKAEIKVQYSTYWNDYWYLLGASANGILYNSTKLQTEVCSCPDFTQSEETTKNTFIVTNYELKFDLLQAYGHKRKESNWYLLWLNGEEGKTSRSNNLDFPWIKLGAWKKVDWFAEKDRDLVWYLLGENSAEEDVAKGKNEQLFSLVSQRVENPMETSSTHFDKLEAWTDVTIVKEGDRMKMKRGNDAKEFANWIDFEYPPELYHCKTNHINCSIQWRDKTAWKGNLNEIEGLGDRRLYLKLHETSNASGTVVSFHDKYGNFIAQIHESVFIKIGKADENNVILTTIITTAAGAAIGLATAGVGAAVAGKAVGAAMTAGAAKGAVAGGLGAFAGGIKGRLINQGETIREEFTIDEFQHKFLRKGHWPISIILSQDNELINRYHANRTLKGIEGNQYFNTGALTSYLTENQFFRAKLLTLNMRGKKEWFRGKIEEGVRIDDGTFAVEEKDWYRLGLPRKRIKSTGAGAPGDIDTLITKKGGGKVIKGIDVATTGRLQICSIFGISGINGGHSGIMKKGTSTDYFKDLCERDLTSLSTNPNTYLGETWWYFPPGLKWSKSYSIPSDKYDVTWHTNEGLENYYDIPASNFTITIDGDCGILTIGEKYEKISRKTSGEPPEGFNNPPPPSGPPSGASGLPGNLEASDEPNPNEPESESYPEPTADIGGMGLEVEPEEEPEDPEPEQQPEDEAEDEPEDPPLEDEKEKEKEEEVDDERTAEDDDEAGI